MYQLIRSWRTINGRSRANATGERNALASAPGGGTDSVTKREKSPGAWEPTRHAVSEPQSWPIRTALESPPSSR
jgi:hypothetical protein